MPRNRFNVVVIAFAFVAGVLFGRYVFEFKSTPTTSGHPDPGASASEISRASSATEATPPQRDAEASVSAQAPIENATFAAVAQPEQTKVPVHAETPISKPQGDPGQLFAGGDLSSPLDTDAHVIDDRSKLHNAYRLSCQFGAGVNAQVGSGAIQTSDASWQGGIITYDVIDAAAGRATMTGTAGATGASTGMVEVRMAGTNAGLSFSTVDPLGDLISTTVFTQRNAQGDFLAVMSTHAAGTGHMASQFYGACYVQ